MAINCNTQYELQDPIYLNVRRNSLLHAGIGNPDDPYDYAAISSKVIAYVNDVNPPFSRMKFSHSKTEVSVYPCNPNQPVKAEVTLFACECILSGVFSPVILAPTIGFAFAAQEVFIGLDQIVDYIIPGGIFPDPENYDIDIDLMNGGPDHPDYIGYTVLQFQPDNPANPMGDGSYFFVIWPQARIKDTGHPS